VFLDERFELACRHFHQYVWSPYLHTVLRCLERERPSLVLVTSGPHQTSGRPWTEFVAGASRILRRRYVKVLQRGDPAVLRVEVWRHRSAEQEGLVSHTSQLSAGSSESPEKADDGPRTRILDL
jgi:hypothetical protein